MTTELEEILLKHIQLNTSFKSTELIDPKLVKLALDAIKEAYELGKSKSVKVSTKELSEISDEVIEKAKELYPYNETDNRISKMSSKRRRFIEGANFVLYKLPSTLDLSESKNVPSDKNIDNWIMWLQKRIPELNRTHNENWLKIALIELSTSSSTVGKGKWVSVNEILPERYDAILFHTDKGYISQGYFIKDLCFEVFTGARYENVTHWMPLPQSPETKTNN